MDEFEPNSMAGRVQKRLKKVGKKAAAASIEATGKPDLVRTIFKAARENRAYGPNYASVARLATALGTTTEWLTKGVGLEEPAASANTGAALNTQSAPGILKAGIIEAGAFRDADHSRSPNGAEMIHLYPDLRYSNCRQAAWEVRGDSMDHARIFEGMWVIGALYEDYQAQKGDVESGAYVIVQRSMSGCSEHEITAKEIRFFKDRFELVPHSSNPAHKSLIVPYSGKGEATEEEISIIAVVIGTYNQF